MAMTALDYEEIRQLLARYDRAVDFGDAEGFAACFTPDGYLEVAGLPVEAQHESDRVVGREALRKWVTALYAGLQGHVRHCQNMPIIEGDGQTATMFSYLFEYRVGNTPPNVGMTLTGVYYDKLAKVDGRWLFTERICRLDPQPEHRDLTPTDIMVRRFDENVQRMLGKGSG
jgi:hypothetical protein